MDVEGHDFAVLASFLNQTTTTSLPLLVAFEAKSLKEKYQATVDLLTERGYVQPSSSCGYTRSSLIYTPQLCDAYL